MDKGKTVTTFLIDGDPKGSKYLQIGNRICKMYIISRSNLDILNNRLELQTPALYILLGENDETRPKAYIGETENFCTRVKDHESKKDFWQKVFLFISLGSDITKTDVKYLECMAIDAALSAKTFELDYNKQKPKEPNIPEYRKCTMDEFFDDVKFLTSFNGCNIFDVKEEDYKLFYLKQRNCDAKGFYDADGFTVLKDSIIVKTPVQSFSWKEKRLGMLKERTEDVGKDTLKLKSDITLTSPSIAAGFCTGSSINGWQAWKDGKDETGQTLDEVYRKQLE